MTTGDRRNIVARTVGRGYFPHQLSWLIDNPLRRLLITPKEFADRIPLQPTSRVLEIGPGSGYFSVELARRIPDGRLELLDLQPEMLEKARRKLERHRLHNVGYTTSNAGVKLPYADASIDVVVMVAVLGEVPNREECLRDVRRVLKPGGRLAVHEHLPIRTASVLPR